MNRTHFLRTAASLLLAASSVCTLAAERATPAEAEALVKKAVAMVKSAGPDKTFEEVTNGKSLKDRDLYVFIYDLNGKCLAHGANPKLVGKDLIGMKDPDGKPLIKMLVDVAKDKGKGWTDTVKFRNPVTDQIQSRVNYIERVGDLAVGSGVFRD
ncbi:Cache domain protein [Burkholderiales bacterium JOSHI_001]|nr:Cache domain protein [Burkholderiales bacterium JOSHI_001]